MDIESLQKMIAAVTYAKENMLEGQMFLIEVDHRVDFIFEDLKLFKSSTYVSKETELLLSKIPISEN
jgi:hypothetical protein